MVCVPYQQYSSILRAINTPLAHAICVLACLTVQSRRAVNHWIVRYYVRVEHPSLTDYYMTLRLVG